MISVVIPSYRNPKCLDICLHSAVENSKEPQEIIVVIDGFKEESQHIIDKYNGNNQITFVVLDSNYGMQHALNMGVYAASNEWILIVNDDNVFPKDWDEALHNECDISNNGVFVITPNQIERNPSIFNFIVHDFGTPDTFNLNQYIETELSYRRSINTSDLDTGEIFPFLIKKKYYMAVGGFDTIYDSPFICDWDFFLKLELIGATFLRVYTLNFYHFGSIATKNGKERDRFNDSERNAAEVFKYKWGFYPIRNEDNSHRPKKSTVGGIQYD